MGIFSKEELARKATPTNIAILRMRTAHGLLSDFVDKAMAILRASLTLQSNMRSVIIALETFRRMHATVKAYFEAKQKSDMDTWRTHLPTWSGIQLAKCLRQAHEGSFDQMFIGLATSPPKGGLAALQWPVLAQTEPLCEQNERITKEFKTWSETVVGGQTPTPMQIEPPACDEGAGEAASTGQAEEASVDAGVMELRKEFASLAAEVRSSYVSLMVRVGSAISIRSGIQSSFIFSKVPGCGWAAHRLRLLGFSLLGPAAPGAERVRQAAVPPDPLVEGRFRAVCASG